MSTLLDKALASWEMAEELHPDETKINFAANRYYYALYQAATWRNDQANPPLTKKTKQKSDGTTVVAEGNHEFATRIIASISKESKRVQMFRTFKTFRITADYKPTNVTKHQLSSYNIMVASELLTELTVIGDAA